MLWNKKERYVPMPFESEAAMEDSVADVKEPLFGKNRIYLNDKRKIGKSGATKNIPDGYLLDLTDHEDPKLFIVEVDLASHQHLKHIAVQILEFSLSFETSRMQVKNIIKEALQKQWCPGKV